jgi:hypothetical protein
MARNLAQRLDRLERLAPEILNTNQGPVYLREGEAIPDGIDPARVVTIKQVLVDASNMPAEELPETLRTLAGDRAAISASFQRPRSQHHADSAWP